MKDKNLNQNTKEWYDTTMRALVERAHRTKSKPTNNNNKQQQSNNNNNNNKNNSTEKKSKRLADAAEAHARSAALSTHRATSGVSFAGAAFQAKYFETKFTRRASLLHDIMNDLSLLPSLPRPVCRVASFGGGPGTDAAGLVILQRTHPSCGDMISFDVTLYDNEPSWKKYISTLASHFGEGVSVSFRLCDVTTGLASPSCDDIIPMDDDYRTVVKNRNVNVDDVDLLLFFYVCNETSDAACHDNAWKFYTDVASRAKVGAVVILADVKSHSALVLTAVMEAMMRVRKCKILKCRGSHQAEVRVFQFL